MITVAVGRITGFVGLTTLVGGWVVVVGFDDGTVNVGKLGVDEALVGSTVVSTGGCCEVGGAMVVVPGRTPGVVVDG